MVPHYLIILMLLISSAALAQKIELKDNGYQGVLVAIADGIPEQPNLIEQIKTFLRDSSSVLYEATKKRAALKNVTILIPSDWESIEAERAKQQTFEKANIRVDHNNVDPLEYSPWVKSLGGCGEPGEYMMLPIKFLTDSRVNVERRYGSLEKVFVHEWAHLRWGIFDEYAEATSASSERFYVSPSTGQIEATRCNVNVRGLFKNKLTRRKCKLDPITSLPEDECKFYPSGGSFAEASYMYHQYLPMVTTFCDDDPTNPLTLHNKEAPTQQNKKCNGRSAWSVMRESEDFKDDRNPPKEDFNTDITFRIVRPSNITQRVVIAMDTSGSMSTLNRKGLLHAAVSEFILYKVLEGSEVGLVEFDSSAVALTQGTVTIQDQTSRLNLAKEVPNDASGGTNIKAGLEESIKVLKAGEVDPAGSRIIMITDGEDSLGWVDQTIPTLVADGIVVDTILFSEDATNAMKTLAERTGGTAYFEPGSTLSSGLLDAFTSSQRQQINDPFKLPQKVLAKIVSIVPGQASDQKFIIDKNLGIDTTVALKWTGSGTTDIILQLHSPSGLLYNISTPSNGDSKTMFTCPGLCESGAWMLQINCNLCYDTELSIQVDSTPQPVQRNPDGSVSLDSFPITVETSISNLIPDFNGQNMQFVTLYATVSKGYAPVINALVRATIEGRSHNEQLLLKDDGAGADQTKDDGIYSGYILNTQEAGKHTITVDVTSNNQTAVRTTGQGSKAAPIQDVEDIQPDQPESKDKQIDEFQRTNPAGFIDVQSVADETVDRFPPSKITDLTVIEAIYEVNLARLQWTAVGDDFDVGTVSRYELVKANNFSTLLEGWQTADRVNSSDILNGSLTNPLPAGSIETLTLKIQNPEDITVVGIIAYDDSGKSSSLSNLVTIKLEFVDVTPPAPIKDLTLASWNIKGKTITLEWTAVADDRANGTVAFYELWKYPDATSTNGTLVDNKDIMKGNLSTPSAPQTREQITLQMTGPGDYYFEVTAWDDSVNPSPHSNRVHAQLHDHVFKPRPGAASSISCSCISWLLIISITIVLIK